MSDTSSPSVHIHPISPSSSFSDSSESRDTGLHSEPTSDEEPDLGAFTTVLREWTHLQPPPRIPVQVRSATSSTTPTFQPSVTGSESPSNRSRNSHIPGNSALSSFTRPPSSSAQPDGSTVWAQAPIASYLYSDTPSNDDEKESIESLAVQGEHTPNSVASAALTVEIASETDFEQSNVHTAHSPSRLSSDSGISLPLTMEPVNNRLNSRETAHLEEETDTSETSKGHPFQETSVPSHSEPSVHFLSQNRPSPTEVSAVTVAAATTTRLSTFVSDSASAFIHNRSRNPEPPRAISDSSSLTTSDSIESSSLSLVSYRISDTLSEANSDGESSSNAYVSSNDPVSMSTSLALKTQKSFTTSHSGSTNSYSTQRPQHLLHHSFPTIPIAQSQSLSSTGSPLPNPHSPLPVAEPEIPVYINDTRPMFRNNVWREGIVVDDLGTPDQPPSETLLYRPPNNPLPGFRPVIDDDDDDDIRVGRNSERAAAAAQPAHSNARLNPQASGYGTASQRVSSSRTNHKPAYVQHEDEEDTLFPAPNTQMHASGPRVIRPSLTPRGISPDPIDSRSQPSTTISSTLNSVQQPLAYPNQSPRSNPLPDELHQQVPQNISTAPLQHTSNQSIPNRCNAMAAVYPESRQFSNIDTPTTLAVVNQPGSYVSPPNASVPSSHYSTPQRQALPELAKNNAHGYPYSLLGLHALPTTIASRGTSTLPSASSIDSDSGIVASQFPSFSDLSDDNSTIQGDLLSFHGGIEDTTLEEAVPSLGVLDGVLNFIAVERQRARNNAVREGSALISTLKSDDSNDTASEEEGDGVNEEFPDVVEGEDGWKHVIGNEAEQPKRKRRRKRPAKIHASIFSIQAPDIIQRHERQDFYPSTAELQALDLSSFSVKKKKFKSAAMTLSGPASAPLISLPLSSEGLKTPIKARLRNKEFLITLPPSKSAFNSKKKGTASVKNFKRPEHAASDDDDAENSDFDAGEKTPTNSDRLERTRLLSTESSMSPINFLGKKGKRVGKREREREQQRHDFTAVEFNLRDVDVLELGAGTGKSDSGLVHEDDLLVDVATKLRLDEDDRAEDNDSLSNLSLLKPPKRRRERSRKRKFRDMAHVHALTGIPGAYQSFPGSPGRLRKYEDTQFAEPVHEQDLQENAEFNENFEYPEIDISGTPEKRKRTRSKRIKHSQSIPDLGVDSHTPDAWSSPAAYSAIKMQRSRINFGREDILGMDKNQLQNYLIASGSGIVLMNTKLDKNQPSPDSKRGRLIALAKQLRDSFPEQREDLGRVILRLERQGGQGAKLKVSNEGTEEISESSKPVPIPYHKRQGARQGRRRAESESIGGIGVFDFDDDQPDEENDAEKLDDSTDLEEEEIDPRGRPPGRGDALVHIFIDHSNILIGLLYHLKRTRVYRKGSAKRAQNRPLPAIFNKASTTNNAHDQAIPASAAFDAVNAAIPLPSFATVSRSFPTTSALSEHMKSKDVDITSNKSAASLDKEREANSDGYEFPNTVEDDSGGGGDLMPGTKEKKYRRRLWHAALALILERGRPVTRRVVVTSSPLYQPMDGIERLGYELRVFIRVPDFGDGLDRERYRDKDKTLSSRPSGVLKTAHSSPISASFTLGSPPATKKRSAAHARHLSGSGGGGLVNQMGPGSLHPYYGTSGNVKFREQGVDELLQLKLHQALAATDHVPEGSTIVLATGDGNVGQFNEDGFLGPVRTALRRGWRVELYAWEDGLSRAWKREFGEGTEWGRSGLFRVIGMEQFAHGLVEALQ